MKFAYGAGIVLMICVAMASSAQGATLEMNRIRNASNAAARGRSEGGLRSGGWVLPAACNVPGYAYGNSVWATLMATNSACWGLRQIQENNKANRQDEERRRQDLARMEAERIAALRQRNKERDDAYRVAQREAWLIDAAARAAASAAVAPAEPVASGASNVISSGFGEDCQGNARAAFARSCSAEIAERYAQCTQRGPSVSQLPNPQCALRFTECIERLGCSPRNAMICLGNCR